MDLEIRQKEKEGVAILELAGRVVAGEDLESLRERIRALAASGNNRIVLDLAQVDYIDSSGLGAMVYCFTTLGKDGGGLKLARLNQRNLELMVLTKLTTVFEIHKTVPDAVNAYFPGRAIKHFDILTFLEAQKGRR
jgi:anti-sigma B factor antagonist